MKVLHIITHFSISSGVARFIYSLIPYQKEQGYRVDVLVLATAVQSYAKEIEKMGCKYIVIGKKQNPGYNPKFIFKLIPYMREYDIVHVHQFPATYWAVIAKKISCGKCKLILTEHSTLNNRQGKKYLKGIEKFIYFRYNAVVAISDAVKVNLHKFVDIQLPVEVIDNGVDLCKFQNAIPLSRKVIGVSDNVIIIIQVARFHPPKDQLTLIKALLHLPDNFHAVFVGIGDTLTMHKQKVKDWGLSERVHFIGARQDVPALLKVADVVVISSNYEGFGLTAVEGMAAGKPVIASGVPGLQEVVQNAGIVFPPNDEIALAHEILHLFRDENFKNKIITQGLTRAKKYNIRVMAQKYDIIYKRVIGDKVKFAN